MNIDHIKRPSPPARIYWGSIEKGARSARVFVKGEITIPNKPDNGPNQTNRHELAAKIQANHG